MSAESAPATAASLRRIPSLDGLRALSIFLVIALHSIQRFAATHDISNHMALVRFFEAIFDGDTGVFIFFVISGYLITSLLLHEHQKRGSISLRGFYFRRAMRILPPLYTYVGFLLLLGWIGKLKIVWLDIISALFFGRAACAWPPRFGGHFVASVPFPGETNTLGPRFARCLLLG
jgi:peptidoglycan/LPS O-acetylase OafA/YrhL